MSPVVVSILVVGVFFIGATVGTRFVAYLYRKGCVPAWLSRCVVLAELSSLEKTKKMEGDTDE